MWYAVKILWDAEADVWVALSDDIPGLLLEADLLDVLIKRVRDAAPELLELNGVQESYEDIRFVLERP